MSVYFYPVGTIYITADPSFKPSQRFGGTWSQIKNRTLWGAQTYTEIGDLTAQLPDIQGTLEFRELGSDNLLIRNASGAFTYNERGEHQSSVKEDSTEYKTRKVKFRASKYNAIYAGADNVVRPTSYGVYIWRRTS